MNRARPGWSNRYGTARQWLQDFAGLAWLIGCVLFIGFFATWTGN